MCFCLLYRLYLTRLGRWLHSRELAKTKELVHVSFENYFSYSNGNIIVYIVPYLKDNYGYII